MPRVLNSSKSTVSAIFALTLAVFFTGLLSSSLVRAQVAPRFTTFQVPDTVTEMGHGLGIVNATDDDGDPVSIVWDFASDPTNQAFYFDTFAATFVKQIDDDVVLFGVGNPGPNPPSPSLQGQTITVRVTASDGVNSTVRTKDVLVAGTNSKPTIILDTSGMGTQADPKLTPGGLSLTSSQSHDVESEIRFAWSLAGYTGGQPCPGKVLVLFGKETDKPSMPIPLITALPGNPMRVNFAYRVLDGMYVLEDTVVGYAASPNGCSEGGGGGGSNTAPNASPGVSVGNAAYGQTVNLFGNFSDPDFADTHSYSWTQIKTSGEPTVTPLSPNARNTSIVTPSTNVTLRYRFTVTDNSNASDSGDVQILVTEQGGGGGGGGGGGSGGSGEGTSVGTVTGSGDCGDGNVPAVATVPETYTISEGFQGQIQATNVDDPDNTEGNPIGGGGTPTPGAVALQWTVTDGKGLMTNGSLSGRTTSTISFTAPQVASQTTLGLQLSALDNKGCGNTYPINLVVENFVVNNNPDVVLTYDVQGQNLNGEAPGGNVVVPSPATVDLDASDSSDPDGDPITFSWQKSNESLTSGSVILSPANSTATLTALSGTNGSVTVNVTVSDNRGGQRALGLTFNFVEPDDLTPLAVAAAMKEGIPLEGPLGNGEEIFLDGSSSTVPEGTQQEIDGLVFEWSQTSGTEVFSKDFDQKMARIRVADITQEETLAFRLLVRNGAAVDSDVVQIPVEPRTVDDGGGGTSDILYPIWGTGPLGNGSALQTTVIIDSLATGDTEDVRIGFYDTSGDPVDVSYMDLLDPENSPKPWDPEQSFTIPGLSSRVFEFVAPGGAAPAGEAGVQSGWAMVTSSGSLKGSTRFQLVDELTGDWLEDVGIPNARVGSRFLTAYRKKDDLAFAIANPTDAQIEVKILLYDREDPGQPINGFLIFVPAGGQVARFLSQLIQTDLEEGYVIIESDDGEEFGLAGLITIDGLFVSAQSVSRVQ